MELQGRDPGCPGGWRPGRGRRMTAVRRAAELLATHRLARTPFPGFPADLRPRTDEEGYAIQDALHDILADEGRGPIAGSKI